MAKQGYCNAHNVKLIPSYQDGSYNVCPVCEEGCKAVGSAFRVENV